MPNWACFRVEGGGVDTLWKRACHHFRWWCTGVMVVVVLVWTVVVSMCSVRGHFEQRGELRGGMEEKPPPPSCVSSKGGSRGVDRSEVTSPSVLHFEQGREWAVMVSSCRVQWCHRHVVYGGGSGGTWRGGVNTLSGK
jgi:hypothetical protein